MAPRLLNKIILQLFELKSQIDMYWEQSKGKIRVLYLNSSER